MIKLIVLDFYIHIEKTTCAISVSQGQKLSIDTLNKAMAITNRSPRRLHIHFGSINYRVPPQFGRSYKVIFRVRTPILVIAKVICQSLSLVSVLICHNLIRKPFWAVLLQPTY